MAREVFAVVEYGKVTNLLVWDPERDPSWQYDGPGQLVPAADDTAIGCTWDGRTFTPPAVLVPPLDDLKQASVARIDTAFRFLTNGVMVDPTKREELRLIALGVINDITSATDADAVAEVEVRGLTALQAAIPSVGG